MLDSCGRFPLSDINRVFIGEVGFYPCISVAFVMSVETGLEGSLNPSSASFYVTSPGLPVAVSLSSVMG